MRRPFVRQQVQTLCGHCFYGSRRLNCSSSVANRWGSSLDKTERSRLIYVRTKKMGTITFVDVSRRCLRGRVSSFLANLNCTMGQETSLPKTDHNIDSILLIIHDILTSNEYTSPARSLGCDGDFVSICSWCKGSTISIQNHQINCMLCFSHRQTTIEREELHIKWGRHICPEILELGN